MSEFAWGFLWGVIVGLVSSMTGIVVALWMDTNKNNPITNPYREYYLACEESFQLSETINVSDKQWQANQKRWQAATEDCLKAELKND